jgi:SNF2 family DNA or RNA helicase
MEIFQNMEPPCCNHNIAENGQCVTTNQETNFVMEADLLLQALKVLLEEWRKDRTNKVLIFTKSVKLLEMLEFHLNTKGLPFDLIYCLLGVHSCWCARI